MKENRKGKEDKKRMMIEVVKDRKKEQKKRRKKTLAMQCYAAAVVAPKIQCGTPERRRRRRAWRITDLDSSSPAAPDVAPFPTNFTPILLIHHRATASPLSRRRIPPLRTTRSKLLSTLLYYIHIYPFLFPSFFFFFFPMVELSFFSSYGQIVALPLQQRPYSLYTCFTLDGPHRFISLVLSLFNSSLLHSRLLFSSRRSLPRPWQIGRQQSDCLVAQQRAAARYRR